MDLNVLDRISTEGLMKMQERIGMILSSRLDTSLRVGRVGTFKDKEGRDRTVVITRINGKTVSGEETGASIKPGCK